MRSALALSALLLLLLLKSQTEAQPQSTDTSDTKEVTSPPAATSTVARPGAYRDPGTDAKEGAPGPTSNSAAVTDTNTNTGEGANAGTGKVPTTVKGSLELSLTPNTITVTAAPTQPSSAAELKHSSEEVTTITSSPVVSDAGPQDANQTQQVTTIKPSTTSIQVITQSLPTEAGEQAATSPAGVNHITSITSAPPASTNPAATDSGVPGNVSREEEDKKTSVTSSGPSPATGSTPVPSGSPSTPSAPPPDTFPGPETNSSQMPSVTETPALSSGSPSPDTVQPTDTSSSPKAVPSTGAPADTSAPLTSAVPHDIHPPPTSTSGSDRIHCVAPERFSEKMLVLNFTQTGLCAGSPPDDKLVTLLCQAAKATFNPAHDQCDIWLAPVPEIQALAIKEITIQTNLLPQDVYEVLRDKWDALKEVGVSNMQLGEQGPPEEAEDRFSMPLIITIICMASFLLLVAALYGCCHHRLSHRKDQQRLTEELQTVENGYHDNPTLEVMETSSEMQEKKVVSLNGELGDSWIVPLDNLTKDDLDEEEDTHL